MATKRCFDLEIGGQVDPYNWILKGVSCSVLGVRVCGRVVSTLNVCSVAKCKYPFRIDGISTENFLSADITSVTIFRDLK